MKKLLIICFAFFSVLTQAQSIDFSHDNSWYVQEFSLELSGADTIWFTTNGKKPQPGTPFTFFYQDPILIESLVNEPYLLSNRMKDFTSDSFHAFTQNKHSDYDFTDTPSVQEVPKKTIIRACTGDCDDVVTRSFGIGAYEIHGWEVELVFDDPNLVWDKDSGAYASGVGMKLPWVLYGQIPGEPDSIQAPNYEVFNRSFLVMKTPVNPQGTPGFTDKAPDHWEEVGVTVLLYKDGEFIAERTGTARPNGNGKLHQPYKGWKVKLEDNVDEAPFTVTDNFVVRGVRTDGAQADVGHTAANLWKLGPPIGRISDYGILHVYNGAFMECFGFYSFGTASDKRYAEHFWGFDDPETMKIDSSFAAYVLKDPHWIDTLAVQLQDTAWLFSQPRSVLQDLVGGEMGWIKRLVHYAIVRPQSVWSDELKLFFDKEGSSIALKDGDSYFSFSSGGFSRGPFEMNQLAFFLTLDTVWGFDAVESFYCDFFPTWAVYAIMFHPENQNYYRNLPFDGYEEAYRYEKVKPLLDYYAEGHYLNRELSQNINGLNFPYFDHQWKKDQIDSFLQIAGNEFLKDWMDFFHPGYGIEDTFTINVNMEDVLVGECDKPEGSVSVNSMNFEESGTRIHVRDYPVEVNANPSPGYVFDRWIEFPNKGQKFMLINDTNTDVTLTPVFTYQSDMCDLQGNIRLNEVQPWNPSGSDKLEIYNPTNESISLCGVCITDNPTQPCKSVFACDSSTIIPAHSYFVLDFKNEDGGDYVVFQFSLNRDGESVGVYTSDSMLIDEMIWEVVDSVSYGYCPESTNFTVLDSLTFGKENFCLGTTVAEMQHTDITIYPNPSNGQCFIDGIPEETQYTISDIAGKIIQNGSTDRSIDLSGTVAGIYFLKLDQMNTKPIKLVIQ